MKDRAKGIMMANFLEKKFLMLLKTMSQGTVFQKGHDTHKNTSHAQGYHTLENKSTHCFSAFHCSLTVCLAVHISSLFFYNYTLKKLKKINFFL